MPKRKLHKLINSIEHKQCGGICKKYLPLDQFGKKAQAWDGKFSYCKSCGAKKTKQHNKAMKEKLKKEREAAPSGFSVCLFHSCTVKGLQPVNQFIHPHVRNDEPTDLCQTCRDKMKEGKEQRKALCQKVWDDWRKTHPCVICMNNPNYEHNYLLIEADHLPEFEKVKACGEMVFWSAKCRGPVAQKVELKKCQATCTFHHRLVTQQRHHDKGRIQKVKCVLRKRKVINKEKHKRGCCKLCDRVVKEGEECAFDFDHRDPKTKFIRNGKAVCPSRFVYLPDALFDIQWPLEQAKCDLLCRNCHKLKDNRDGYRK